MSKADFEDWHTDVFMFQCGLHIKNSRFVVFVSPTIFVGFIFEATLFTPHLTSLHTPLHSVPRESASPHYTSIHPTPLICISERPSGSPYAQVQKRLCFIEFSAVHAPQGGGVSPRTYRCRIGPVLSSTLHFTHLREAEWLPVRTGAE